MLTRRHFLTLSGAAALVSATPAVAAQTVTLGGDAFGSFWRLTLPGDADTTQAELCVQGVVAQVDGLFSPYRAESELARFNNTHSTDWISLSPQSRTVIAAALDIATRSTGAFDPTVGPVVARFGFGPILGAEQGHFSQLHLGAQGLRKDLAGLSLDLCGIAKGHALDLVAERLDALGIKDYLLDLGGELLARGAHPAGRGWQVAIEASDGLSGLRHMVSLDGLAIATSGLVAQGFQFGGQMLGHIIDPHANAPVSWETASVSVLAQTAMEADGWATALMALPHETAIGLAEAQGLDALFQLRKATGQSSVTTGRFSAHLLA